MSTLISISSTLTYIGYLVLAVIVLLLMVLIHELGHYTAGKLLKFKINEFSVGFGPKLLQKTKKDGEKITLRAFPLGGYCAFEGETEENKDNPAAFSNQKPWKRLIVLFFGAFFNFLSGIIFSFILLVSVGYDLVEVKTVDSTSINYGVFEVGDVFLGVEGEEVNFVYDTYLSSLISASVAKNFPTEVTNITENSDYSEFVVGDVTYYATTGSLTFNLRRNGKEISTDGYVYLLYDADGAYKGWSLVSDSVEDFAIATHQYTFFEAITQAVPFTCKWAWKIILIVGDLLTGQLGLDSLGGPVTTINTIATYTSMSFSYLLVLLPLIAVNLAVFNLLPIPALDGFQMLFVLIEWIRKKPVKQEVVNLINNIGLIVLLLFVIVVDVMQFI